MGTESSALSVSQLNFFIRSLIESEPRLRRVTAIGEISNFVDHYKTGHLYFALKDATAAIKAVMFRSDASRLAFRPENGMTVIVFGRVAVYERDGVYQICVEKMIPAGAGALAAAYEQLKKRLAAEGLFDGAKKRRLPAYPHAIGVITSRSGAAVRDIVNVLSRRWPVARIVLYPVLVQGAGAAASVAAAIRQANEDGDADVLIVARGGGSAEDLWAFNEELLVRAVAGSEIPTVSGVGHETDVTLCDLAADLRAPTPSAAAELCAPDIGAERDKVRRLARLLGDRTQRQLAFLRQRAVQYGVGRAKSRLDRLVCGGMQYVDELDVRMNRTVKTKIEKERLTLARLSGALELTDPLKILARGYAVCEKDGAVVREIAGVEVGDTVRLRLRGGAADCVVRNKEVYENE